MTQQTCPANGATEANDPCKEWHYGHILSMLRGEGQCSDACPHCGGICTERRAAPPEPGPAETGDSVVVDGLTYQRRDGLWWQTDLTQNSGDYSLPLFACGMLDEIVRLRSASPARGEESGERETLRRLLEKRLNELADEDGDVVLSTQRGRFCFEASNLLDLLAPRLSPEASHTTPEVL